MKRPASSASHNSECRSGDEAIAFVLPERFETTEAAHAEDHLRERRMKRLQNARWSNNSRTLIDKAWLARQLPPTCELPKLSRRAIKDLRRRLRRGLKGGKGARSLASSMWMRTIRVAFLEALWRALADYADEELTTVTVIYSGWSLTPAELDMISAAQLKAQFRTHLDRIGVTRVPGPLIAVLHGEFESTSGRYQLHFHIVTTTLKAAVLKKGLKNKNIAGYRVTATGSVPVQRKPVRDRIRQLSYLVKSFWPSKPVIIQKDGKAKRVRRGRRIPEPFGAQVLLWLDRQRFFDLVILSGCWSPRAGGPPAMRALFLLCREVG